MKHLVKITTKDEIEVIDVRGSVGKTIYEELRGHFKIVTPTLLPKPFIMLVDQEGLFKSLPISFIGTNLYKTSPSSSYIAGDVIIAKQEKLSEGESHLVGLDQKDIAFLRETLKRMGQALNMSLNL